MHLSLTSIVCLVYELCVTEVTRYYQIDYALILCSVKFLIVFEWNELTFCAYSYCLFLSPCHEVDKPKHNSTGTTQRLHIVLVIQCCQLLYLWMLPYLVSLVPNNIQKVMTLSGIVNHKIKKKKMLHQTFL